MFTIQFSQSKGLCESLCDEIRKQISKNILHPNEKLPSKRSLAEHLGISVITVQNAYAELIDEGYIYSIEKKGFFVTDILPNLGTNQTGEINNRIDKKTSETSTSNEKNQISNFFADFSSNSTNPDKFPFSLWAHLTRKVLTSDYGKENLLNRVNAKGVFELRNAISKYLLEFRNMSVNPDQIVIGAGTESLCSMIVQLLGNEKIYAVENPGYHKISKVFQANNACVKHIEIDESGINPYELLKENVDVVHLSPSHHFPTGVVMPIRRRREMLSWAKDNDGYIIEDEYDSEFRFNGKPLPSLQSSDENGRVIYINTFSKTLAPSFRISYMILPPSLLDKFDKKLGFYSCLVSAFEQFTLATFIENGFYGKHIIRMKNYYRNLRNNLINAINSSTIKQNATIHEENSGLHFILELNENLDIQKIREKFLEEKINISPLSDFSYLKSGPIEQNSVKTKNSFVLNYSGIEKDKITEIVRRMEKIIGK